jgi:NAD(P)-dependent dehydrogenase (short-subunit alcohol dehydrogenase family)
MNLAVGKFGLRALAQSMARELGPQGIHVAHVIVDGQIDTGSEYVKNREKRELLNPSALAQVYWDLHKQDPTVWTFELDVRPNVERW